MEAEDGQELRVGSLVPVLVEQVVNDTLLVSLKCGEKNYSGILLDCSKKSGLFCMPSPSFPKNDDSPNSSCNSIPTDANFSHPLSETPVQDTGLPVKSNTDQDSPLLLPPPGTVSSYPPYFEGAPFPPPLWLRHSYNQWVPQPPPRSIKRTKRRVSRNRDSGRLTMSTIRLRPRQVLCEKCKNTLNSEESPKDKNKEQQNTRGGKRIQSEDKEKQKVESDPEERKMTKERRQENSSSIDLLQRTPSKDLIHRSPVIKISYSTPQGKGEVVKIPSRVHGSVEPFCLNQTQENKSRDQELSKDSERCRASRSRESQVASLPKIKLSKPIHSNVDIPPPKIRIRPQRVNDGQNVSVYKSELVDQLNAETRMQRLQGSQESETDSSAYYMDSSADRSYDVSLGSSGEDDDFKEFPHGKDGHNLNLLVNFRKRKADSSSASLCSNDSLDESKSS
uniref:PWWP domain-containing protein 2B n=2 Tax=Pyxicephalus adspersus TaxID=30357 RepID=A0AAV2ZYF1_PYXAD|nr:TPA: hypothetical protein GDO54_004274 [Pyxicephalus adspersus]